MKITDVLNEQTIKQIDKKIPLEKINSIKNLERIGKGIFASVYQSKSNPNEVIKIAHVLSPNDATVKFIKLAMENQDNPHFPRIYGAKIYYSEDTRVHKNIDVDFKYVLVVRMEKLVPLTNPKISHMLPVFMRQLGIEDSTIKNILGSEYSDTNLEDLSSKELFDLGRAMQTLFFEKESVNKYSKLTRNDQLAYALSVLYKLLMSNEDSFPDIHKDNVMVRVGNPPQLVITDPLMEIPM